MRQRHAFTMLELLIVITVIGVLAGMLIVVIQMIGRTMKVNKTVAIMDIALAGLAVAETQNINISLVEHPLANSVPPRSPFLRAIAVPARFAVGDPVATAGEALRMVEAAQPNAVA